MKTDDKVTNIPVKQQKPLRTWLGKWRAQQLADPFELAKPKKIKVE